MDVMVKAMRWYLGDWFRYFYGLYVGVLDVRVALWTTFFLTLLIYVHPAKLTEPLEFRYLLPCRKR